MTQGFLKVVNMAIAAGWLALAVMLLRLLLRKAPKWTAVALWALVGLRLVCPVTVESAFSLIPSAETIPATLMTDPIPTFHTGVGAMNYALNPALGQAITQDDRLQTAVPILAAVWLLGVVLMAGYALVSYLLLRRRLSTAVRVEDGIYRSEAAASPFVLGLFRPRIYLPFGLEGEALELVTAHERAHIRRGDHWWKPLGFLLLAVYWFHPLLWLAYGLFCRDIERSCDEKVLGELEGDRRAAYAQALLGCETGGWTLGVCPVAFGELGVKERVKAVLHYKKPAFWLILVAMAACVAAAVCFLTNPVGPAPKAEKWVDYLLEDRPQDDEHTATLPEFPGVTFRYTALTVTAETAEGSVDLFHGMPIHSVYFADLNGDGKREICATVSIGSGIIDDRIEVYDYANAQAYTLADRFQFDYCLVLEGDTLLAEQCPYLYGISRIIVEANRGPLVLKDGELSMVGAWEEVPEPTAKPDSQVTVPTREEGEALSEQELGEKLLGVSRQQLWDAWGQPESSFSGMRGETYYLPSGKRGVTTYYNINFVVEGVHFISLDSDGKPIWAEDVPAAE